jgi:hypothetical protein
LVKTKILTSPIFPLAQPHLIFSPHIIGCTYTMFEHIKQKKSPVKVDFEDERKYNFVEIFDEFTEKSSNKYLLVDFFWNKLKRGIQS